MSTAILSVPTGSLVELHDHVAALFETIEGMEPGSLRTQAEEELRVYLESEIRKVDAVSAYLNQCETQQLAAQAEIARLTERKKAWANREDRIRNYVQRVMEEFGEKKLEGRTATFTLRAAPASVVILNEYEIPEEFKRTTVTVAVDKSAVKKAINSGRDVPGADLSIGKNTLMVK